MESEWKWGLSIHLVSPDGVSRKAELSFQENESLQDTSAIALRTIVFVMSQLLFPDKQGFNYHRGVDRTLDFHSTKQDIPSGTEDYR